LTRGYVWRKYVADDATEYALLVDADHATDTDRGWATVAAGTPALPRGSHPRRVLGLSPSSGRPGSAVIGDPSADLWTGVATTFTVEANDQTTDTMTVTERRAERIRVAT
jgi:hypothetical protein